MRHRVTALGEQTSLADCKRRAGQRLLLAVGPGDLSRGLTQVLGQLTPAGFLLDTSQVEEPAHLQELCRELAALLPASHPALICTRHDRGPICPGATDWPPLRWVANAGDWALAQELGAAWRTELGALGIHLQLGPRLDLAPLGGDPLPALDGDLADLLAGPDAVRAAELTRALLADQGPGQAGSCPTCFQGHADTDGRLLALEKELPGLVAEDLAPLRAAVAAGVPALLAGYRIWSGFHEERPACCVSGLLRDQLRDAMGFCGLLLVEDLALGPVRSRLRLDGQLEQCLFASADLLVVGGAPPLQVRVYEALVHLQEDQPVFDDLTIISDRRLLAARERLLVGPAPAGLERVGSTQHRDLALMVRARGG